MHHPGQRNIAVTKDHQQIDYVQNAYEFNTDANEKPIVWVPVVQNFLRPNQKWRFSIIPAVLRMAGSLQKSTEVMQTMHNLIKVPEVAATMRDLSKEMMKVSNVIYYISFYIM